MIELTPIQKISASVELFDWLFRENEAEYFDWIEKYKEEKGMYPFEVNDDHRNLIRDAFIESVILRK